MKTSKTVAFNSETEADLYQYANTLVNFSEYVKSKLKEDMQKLDVVPDVKKCIVCNMPNTLLKKHALMNAMKYTENNSIKKLMKEKN